MGMEAWDTPWEWDKPWEDRMSTINRWPRGNVGQTWKAVTTTVHHPQTTDGGQGTAGTMLTPDGARTREEGNRVETRGAQEGGKETPTAEVAEEDQGIQGDMQAMGAEPNPTDTPEQTRTGQSQRHPRRRSQSQRQARKKGPTKPFRLAHQTKKW